MEGAVAIAVIIIAGFVAFILWARSATGRMTLRDTLGEPHTSFTKRNRLVKRHSATRRGSARPKKAATKRPNR